MTAKSVLMGPPKACARGACPHLLRHWK